MERHAVRKGRMVAITGPGQRLYWPGLWPKVTKEWRAFVRHNLAIAREEAYEILQENEDTTGLP